MSDEEFDDRLAAQRPVPAAAFRGDLRREIAAARPGRHRPEHLWLMAGVSAAVGVALLLLALALS